MKLLYEQQNKSTVDIGNIFNIPPSSVLGYLKRSNTKIRKNTHFVKKYECNEDAFSNIISQEQAYWLGFILADGYIHKKTNTLSISLAAKDIEHLQQLKSFMKADNKIYEREYKRSKYKSTAICNISIKSKKLIDDLNKLGIVQNKTFIAKTPNIHERLLPHFYRGLLDGDGWISLYKQKTYDTLETGICGNWYIITDLSEYLHKLNIKHTITTDRSAFRIRLNNKKAIIFLDEIYNNANIFLQRKKDNYIKYKEIIHLSPVSELPEGITKTKHNTFRVRSYYKYIGTYKTLEKAIIKQQEYFDTLPKLF